MHIDTSRSLLVLVILALVLFGCTTTVQRPTPTSPAQAVTVEVPVPVTVEVTRIVPQQIIVEATPTPPQACTPASFEDAEEIVIGAILPLSTSGDMLAGFSMQAALSIAVSEINEASGVRGLPIRLVTYDSEGDASQSPALVSRLAREDCAVAITGFLHDDVALAAGARSSAINMPLIVAGATTNDLASQQYTNVFRIAPSDTMLAEMPAKWLAEVGDYNRDDRLFVVNLVDSRGSDTTRMAGIEAKLAEYGIEYQTVPVDLPASDFSSVIARIVSMGQLPDAVLIFVAGESALELEQQIREAGIGPHRNSLIVNSESALDSARFWQIVPDGLGTVASRIGPWHSTVTASGHTFALKYANYFGHWPEYYAFAAYDSVYLIADALARAASPTGSDLVPALAATDATLGSGHYYFPYTAPRESDQAALSEHLWNQWPEVHTLYLQYDELGQSSSDMPVVWPQRYRSTEGPLAWTPPPD